MDIIIMIKILTFVTTECSSVTGKSSPTERKRARAISQNK